MTALAADRNTPRRPGELLNLPLAAVLVYAGSIACINSSGYATKGAASTSLKTVGVFTQTVDNSGGSAGDKRVEVQKGIFRFANSASGDAITLADVGASCYVVDDQTVAKTNGSSSRSVAGTIWDVDAQGVWVQFI